MQQEAFPKSSVVLQTLYSFTCGLVTSGDGVCRTSRMLVIVTPGAGAERRVRIYDRTPLSQPNNVRDLEVEHAVCSHPAMRSAQGFSCKIVLLRKLCHRNLVVSCCFFPS
jgi:hypothetical protein